MKIKTNPDDMWKIKINDGYCTYEYEMKATNNNVSIKEIANHVARKLKAISSQGTFRKRF